MHRIGPAFTLAKRHVRVSTKCARDYTQPYTKSNRPGFRMTIRTGAAARGQRLGSVYSPPPERRGLPAAEARPAASSVPRLTFLGVGVRRRRVFSAFSSRIPSLFVTVALSFFRQ